MLRVTDAGIGRLRACPQLRELGLAKLAISDKALTDLSKCAELVTLELRDCSALTRAGIESLHRVKPAIRISVQIDGREVGMLHHEHIQWMSAPKRDPQSDANTNRAPPAN